MYELSEVRRERYWKKKEVTAVSFSDFVLYF